MLTKTLSNAAKLVDGASRLRRFKKKMIDTDRVYQPGFAVYITLEFKENSWKLYPLHKNRNLSSLP
jgi:hypothetical protein